MLKSLFTLAAVVFIGAVPLGAQDEKRDSSDSTTGKLDEFTDLLRDASEVFRVKLVRYGDRYRYEAVEWLKGGSPGQPEVGEFHPYDQVLEFDINSGLVWREYLYVTGANDTSRHISEFFPYWSREFAISDGKISITDSDHAKGVPLESIRRLRKSVQPPAARDLHPYAIRAVPVSP